MKYKWLNKQNNKKLIIFFNGLGMDENVVKHLETEDYDVVMFYDYNDLETDFVMEEYEEKYLVAWSMGVMVATNFGMTLPPNPNRSENAQRFAFSSAESQVAGEQNLLSCIKSATAINGTFKPIDAEYGINPRVYELTIKGFKPERFVLNMFDERDAFNLDTSPQPSPQGEGAVSTPPQPYPLEESSALPHPPTPSLKGRGGSARDAENQKSELVAMKAYSANENFKYNRVLISDNDKIIPTKSQCAFWGVEPNLKSGHCPFFLFKKWSELL